jgi:hypothetical protein
MKNHRFSIISITIILVLLLSACSSGAGNSTVNSSTAASEKPAPPEGAPAGTPPADMPQGTPPAAEVTSTTQATLTAEANATTATETPQTTTASVTTVPQTEPTAEAVSSPEATVLNLNSVIIVSGKTYNKTHQDITADGDNQSATLVTKGGTLTVGYVNVTTSGSSTSLDNSSLFGQNAANLANDKSTLKVLYSTVKTSGKGAAGIFARGQWTNATVLDTTIDTTGDDSPAVMAAIGATMDVTNATITTSGQNSGAFATDHGDTSISIDNSTASTSGTDSPAIDAAAKGNVIAGKSKFSTSASPAVSVKEASTVTLTDSDLTTSADDQALIAFIKGMDDGQSGNKFSMSGGSMTNSGSQGALISNTNTTAVVELSKVTTTVKSGVLIEAKAGEDNEGGVLNVSLSGMDLSGNVIVDSTSKVSVELKDSSKLSGAINSERTAYNANLSMDSSSSWNVTADSYLTKFADADGISGTSITNITGNGFTVYYNNNANVYLKGKIYTLTGGGYLKPLN